MRRRLPGFYTLNRPLGKMEYAASVAVLCRELVQCGFGGQVFQTAGGDVRVQVAALAQQTRIPKPRDVTLSAGFAWRTT